MTQQSKKILATIFIIFNLLMMIRAQLPPNLPVINFVYKPVTFVQNYLSMWRGWSMFAPNPLRTNSFIDAKVTFEDGSEEIYNFERVTNGDLLDRYMKNERYRKFMTDGVRLDRNRFLWPDAARFAVKKVSKLYKNKKPTFVILRRNWQQIPNWNKQFIPHRTIPNEEFKTFEFYTYKVRE